jgi:acetolactate synthase I/II/III large subunit
MKFTDVIAETIKSNNVSCVFGLQGGAVVHVFDSLEKLKVPVIYTHHESTASFASAANSKATRGLGCTVVTSGPGATNAITGLLGAWQDSIPVLFLSGQVRSSHMSYGRPVRQVGSQEANIIDVVKPITKYAQTIASADDIQDELNKAIEIAISGRPGPVWLDLPLEYQWMDVPFDESKCIKIKPKYHQPILTNDILSFRGLLHKSKSPIFVLGYGVLLSKSESLIRDFIVKNNFRCVTTWTAAGIFSTKDIHNVGILGMSGQAGANKAVFNTDLLIALGTHLSIPHTTTLTDTYAPKAKKVFVNIDKDQLENLNLDSDLSIEADLSYFMSQIKNFEFGNKDYKKIDSFKALNFKPKPAKSTLVDPNVFFRRLTELTDKDDAIIVDGGGTALYTGFQSSSLSQDQSIICSSAISSMGTGLAETIGAYMSNKYKQLYCIIGDGSALMNIQDLCTIAELNIPVVVCIINNNGYLAIRHTQQGFLDDRYYGTHPDWKLGNVNFKKVAFAFNIKYQILDKNSDIDSICNKVLGKHYPVILEIKTPEDQPALFSQQYKKNKDGTATPLSLEFMK